MGFRFVHPSLLGYQPHFLAAGEQDMLVAYLESVPVVELADRDITSTFAFVAPRAGAVTVQGRREAAAGWPVWRDDGAVAGVGLPEPLSALARRVDEALAGAGEVWDAAGTGPQPMTSVYVDRYPAGGSFFPHTDRDCYGPIVAGVSVGPGSCRLTFQSGTTTDATLVLESGSMYVFSGSLRAPPYQHLISDVTDLRFGVTFRFASRALDGDRS